MSHGLLFSSCRHTHCPMRPLFRDRKAHNLHNLIGGMKLDSLEMTNMNLKWIIIYVSITSSFFAVATHFMEFLLVCVVFFNAQIRWIRKILFVWFCLLFWQGEGGSFVFIFSELSWKLQLIEVSWTSSALFNPQAVNNKSNKNHIHGFPLI